MDRLATLSSFVSVAESGSFSAAAEVLGLTQPAISQHIRALEARLGVRLFDRTTRKVALTEAGARYLDHARAILGRLDEADRSVSRLESSMVGRLSIGAPVGFGTSLLGSYLLEFKKAFPELLLDVSLTDRFVDVIAERLDVSIRMGGTMDERLIARKIGTIERCLAATPGYLDRKARPRHPDDLSNHDYVLHSQVAGGEKFRMTSAQGETAEVRVDPVFRSDNSLLTGEAISAGLGIGLMHKLLLDPLAEAGKLEYVLPDWRYEPQHIHAVYPSNRYIPLKVRIFVDGLASYLRALGGGISPGANASTG
jgi:DNA-binding transcriptional LysR family regulator